MQATLVLEGSDAKQLEAIRNALAPELDDGPQSSRVRTDSTPSSVTWTVEADTLAHLRASIHTLLRLAAMVDASLAAASSQE